MTEVFVDGQRLDGIHGVEFNQSLLGPTIETSKMVREGYLFQFATGKFLVGPLTYFAFTHNGLYPLESARTRGAIEARRDRRRHG